MKGDFTRFRYRPDKHYSSVRQQQGRVWLDSDWNEQIAIQSHLEQTEAIDVIGCCGVPKYSGGFLLTPVSQGGAPDLLISPGRMYVHGLLYELLAGATIPLQRVAPAQARVANLVIDGQPLAANQWVEIFDGETALGIARIASIADLTLTLAWSNSLPASATLRLRRHDSYRTQPDFPLPPEAELTPGTHYLAYLDVWQRHVSAVEDPEIREVALGGPDTTTRTRTIAQVKLRALPAGTPPPTCAQLGRCWSPEGSASSARLRARAEPDPTSADPCIVPARAGYRRLENQLYRVEIHAGSADAGGPTFKWSRDNGSVIYPVAAVNVAQQRITLSQPGRDRYFSLDQDDWVELVDDDYTLRGEADPLLQIAQLDENGTLVELRAAPSATTGQDSTRRPLLRRWDHAAPEGIALVNGALPVSIAEGTWFELEDGVQIFFEPGRSYQRGDFWTIPARTAINDTAGDVLWPRDGDEPRFEARHGTEHHYCALGVLTATGAGWTFTDCRRIFPPLTEIDRGGCCVDVHPGEDIRQAIATVLAAGGGRVCLCAGLHVLAGELDLRGARHLTIGGQGTATILRLLPASDRSSAGIILRGGAHIDFEDLTLVSEDAAALITIYAGEPTTNAPARNSSRAIALRRMTMVNQSNRDVKALRCAIRLADAVNVLIDECHIAAPLGIISLLGEQLPAPPSDAAPGGAEGRQVGFDDLARGQTFRVGERLTSNGVMGETREFTWSNGQTTNQGFARVEAARLSGGSGNELNLNNINLGFAAGGAPWREISAQFGYGGGNLNLSVNGELRNTGSPTALNNQTIGGVAVSVTFAAPGNQRQGVIRLSGAIDRFALGGQEFWIDNLAFAGEPALPPPADYGDGVAELRLIHSRIRFEEAGLAALRADNWLIADCDLRGMNLLPTTVGEHARPGDTLVSHQAWLRRLDETIFAPESRGDRGIALYTYLWHHGELRDSRIESGDGVFAWLWIGGTIAGNQIDVRRLGILAAWLQEAAITGNTIAEITPSKIAEADEGGVIARRLIGDSSRSIALALGGSHRARIETNLLRCDNGLLNVPLSDLYGEIRRFVAIVVMLYETPGGALPVERLAIWMLLEELARITGLRQLRDQLQELLAQFAQSAAPVLFLAAEWLAEFLARQQDAATELALPQIALLLHDNDIAASQRCIALADFIPLGGIRVTHNRLHTVAGQALALNALPLAANVQLTIFAWRFLVQTVERLIERTAAAIGANNALPAAARAALLTLLQTGARLIERWSIQAEGWLEADYRVESNSIRSRATAVESNLFELAVITNQITMQEQPIGATERIDIIRTLDASRALAPIARAARGGATSDLRASARIVAAEPALLRTAAARRDISDAAARIGASGDATLRDNAARLSSAVAARDETATRAEIAKLAAALGQQFSSYGIALSGAGCRAIGNQIIVPPDTDRQTWALGGLRVAIDPQQFILAVVLSMAGGAQSTDAIGITETLIEGNEIIGGAGHGIEARGNGDQPAALFDLKINANQVRGMAGAGILVEETILAAGVDITANHVINCSGIAALAALTDAAGGIVGRNIFFGRLRGNRITGCGAAQPADDAWGIDLDTVFHAALADNAVQNNGAEFDAAERLLLNGGIRVSRAYGEIGVKQCEIVWNRGLALLIDNLTRDEDIDPASLTAMRLALLNTYLKRDAQTPLAPVGLDTASIQGNRIEGLSAKQNNTAVIVGQPAGLLGIVRQVAALLLNNNALAGGILRVEGAQGGVISGNIAAPGGIIAQNPPVPANLVDGLNLPPVTRIP